MLYDYSQLQKLSMEDSQIPLQRYLYKYHYKRKEIKKLKTHEKDFLFNNMYILRNDKGVKCFDLSTIDEAAEYYYNKLILTYSDNLNFDKPTKNPFGNIIDAQTMIKDKAWFDSYYDGWKKQLEAKKGKYFNVISTELNRRLKDLELAYNEGEITEEDYNYHIKYLHTIAFFIYYKVKLFFDGRTDKFIQLTVSGESIIVNIYSFVHILFRHYIPSLDIGIPDRSINDPIPFLDIENLPLSIKDLLVRYFNCNKAPLVSSQEYLLFSFKREKYIIWLKYRELEELNNDLGFEFRTLYRCKEQRDLDKFHELTEHKIDADVSFFF